ncbi:MAG TPA: OB-fold domain-containing protein [Acidimicrobiales bacterium]|nr:OB-fold domain-containing protein [Acidimicrobiales bacterium]
MTDERSETTEPFGPQRFQPTPTETTEVFWEATRNRTYLVQWCTACDAPIFYPREVCPQCLRSDALTWRPSSGRGQIYAHSVQHRPAHPGMADLVPYVVALVDLDAGHGGRTVRIMSNITEVDPGDVHNGDAVGLVWEPLDDGRHLAVFTPAGAPADTAAGAHDGATSDA